MVIARVLQVFAVLTLVGSVSLAVQALPFPESEARRRERLFCEAMALTDRVLSPQGTPRPCPLPPGTLDVLVLSLAFSGALSGFLLFGFSALLLDVRRISERLAAPAAPPAETPPEPPVRKAEEVDRLRRLPEPAELAASIAASVRPGQAFTLQQIDAVIDALEGAALRAGQPFHRSAAGATAMRLLTEAVERRLA